VKASGEMPGLLWEAERSRARVMIEYYDERERVDSRTTERQCTEREIPRE
jgi:hypothetical protein